MAYDATPVPRGTSRRWEVLMSDADRERPAPPRLVAADVQRDHRVLHDLSLALLREIPLLVEGTTLVRLREYIDLHDPARADFRAEGGEGVKPGQRVVARAEVSADAWNELRAACARAVQRRPLRRAS